MKVLSTLFLVLLFCFACKKRVESENEKQIITNIELENLIKKEIIASFQKKWDDSIIYVCNNKLSFYFENFVQEELYIEKDLKKDIVIDTISITPPPPPPPTGILAEFLKDKWDFTNTSSIRFINWDFDNPIHTFEQIHLDYKRFLAISDFRYINRTQTIWFHVREENNKKWNCIINEDFYGFKKENNRWKKISLNP